MPTERPDTTHEDLRSRFHELGEHLERSLDDPSDITQAPLGGARRAPATRRLLAPVAAALLVAAAGGAWLEGQGSDGNDRVVATSDSPSDSPPGEDAESERTGALPGSSPRIEALKATFAETAECLKAEGFGVHGPFPASDGRGLMYLVSSPQDGPWLAADNACESPFNSLARDFALSAPLEDRVALVEEFNRVLACVDPTAEPRPTTASRVDYLECDVEAEGIIQFALRVSPDAEHPCLGAG